MTILFGNHKITHAPGVSLPYCLIREPLSACFLHPEISVCLHGWSRPLRKASPTSTACQYLEGFHHEFPSELPLPQRWVLRTSLECGLHEMLDKLALWAQEPPRQLRLWRAGVGSVSTVSRTRQAHLGTRSACSFPAGIFT